MGRQLRTENDLKVRQPLSVIHIVSNNPEVRKLLTGFEDLITDELNIKSVVYGSDETTMADVSVKADFKKLGPRFGAQMKTVAAAIVKLSSSQAALLVAGKDVLLETEGGSGITVTSEDVVVQRTPKAGMVVASEGDVIVGIETALTPELVQEGLSREFVSRIQNLRKEADFEVTQRIAITVAGDADLVAAVTKYTDYIKTETLCEKLVFADVLQVEPCDLNGHQVWIHVDKNA
jgi:isoleucyl-tRNA synthetase